jgi:hypothetical protein
LSPWSAPSRTAASAPRPHRRARKGLQICPRQDSVKILR